MVNLCKCARIFSSVQFSDVEWSSSVSVSCVRRKLSVVEVHAIMFDKCFSGNLN